MTLDPGEAIDLFSTLFDLSLWACGFIAIAYLMGIISIFSRRVRAIRLNLGRRR